MVLPQYLCTKNICDMVKNKILLITLYAFTCMSIWGQSDGVWSLSNCIDRAKQENISLKRNRISAAQAKISVEEAKNSRLPSVSFSTNQGLTNHPFLANSSSISGSQVISNTHKTSYSGNYGINASMPLYDGGVIKNTIKQQEINSQIAELNIESSEISIVEEITRIYVQILYAQAAITQDKEQIALAQKQVDRARALFKSGLLNKADVSQLESQLANDQYQLVADETSREDYLLQLKQLLEIDGSTEISISDPVLEDNVLAPLPDKKDVYTAALMLRPEIKAGQLSIDKSEIDVKIAEAGNKPQINASAGISTLTTSSGGNIFTQLKEQWSNSLGVSLSLPIYDRGKTKNAVAKARLEKENNELALADTQKQLWKTIENYWLNANSAQQRYIAAQANVKAARTSLDLTSEQFRLGLKNIVELMNDKTNMSKSMQQMLQAKYMAVLNSALLRYYQGESINL